MSEEQQQKKSPYIPVTLDALQLFPEMAERLGISFGDVCGGHCRMWLNAWKTKSAYLTRERLAVCFPCKDLDLLIEVLVACGFLDVPKERPDLHIRGAEKWLGILKTKADAGSKGGRLSAERGHWRKNLKQYASDEIEPDQRGEIEPDSEPSASEERSGSAKRSEALPSRSPDLQISNKESPPTHASAAGQVGQAPPRPKSDRKKSAQEEIGAAFKQRRQAATGAPDDVHGVKELTSRLKQPLEDHGKPAILAALEPFFEDKLWAGTLNPPYPLDAFIGKIAKYVDLSKRRAPKPDPDGLERDASGFRILRSPDDFRRIEERKARETEEYLAQRKATT